MADSHSGASHQRTPSGSGQPGAALAFSSTTPPSLGTSPRSPRLASSWGTAQTEQRAPLATHTANRASIGHALRVQVPIAAPSPPQRRSLVGGLPSPVVGGPGTPPSQRNSPKVAQAGGGSPRISTGAGGASSSPRTGAAGGPAFPARLSSRQVSGSAASGEPRSPRTIEEARSSGGGLAERSPKSSTGSTRRKPPPPLEFLNEPVSPTTRVAGEEPYSAASSTGGFTPVENPSPSKEEERDTLSGLINFDPSSSPVLTTDIPSSRLSLSDDLSVEQSNPSYLSSPAFDPSSSTRSYQPSSSSSSAYGNGVGLGIPFSMSAAANLSSLASSPPSSSRYPIPIPPIPSTSPTTSPTDTYRSPAFQRRDSDSPVTDRGQLIGLGELATPRWTSGPLERRWGAAPESEERQYQQQQGQGTQRRGEKLEERFDVVGSYGLEQEPMPLARTGKNVVESPTISRPTPRYSSGANRPYTTYDSPNRPFAGSSNLYAPSLLPTSASSATIATDASPAALLDFRSTDPTAQSFGPLDFFAPPAVSPTYSLDAISVHDDSPKQRGGYSAGGYSAVEQGSSTPREQPRVAADELSQTVRRAEVPRRRDSTRRKSVASASGSVPNSAGPGQSWTTSAGQEQDVIGLGFEHEIDPPLPVSAEEGGARKRVSSSASSAATSGKRSSTRSLSMSVDGKTSAKQHRRSSTGKGSFAHLPPSPAASSTSHVFSASTSSASAPALPPLANFPLSGSTSSAPPLPTSSVSTPSARTPDHARLSRHSFHSHHSSPSIVAASILRHTRDLEGVDLDIEHAAAVDEGTAAALAKLDGLSSPRMSRIASSSNTSSVPTPTSAETRSRKSSRGPGDAPVPPPMNPRRDSSQSVKRRARSSTGESGSAAAREVEKAFAGESSVPSRSTSSNASPAPPPPVLPSPPIYPTTSPAMPMPRSPLSPSASQMSSATTTRLPSQTRLASSTSTAPSEVPFPSSNSFKRGSSSSASMTAGTWTSGSHDSTSATSLATRSTASKYRRSSAGSDISSTHSTGDGRPGPERGDSAGEIERGGADIPPVPPLPKDWETYRPTTNTSSASSASAQHSPRFDYDARRPSEASSFNDSLSGPLSPRAPPMQPTRSTASSSGRSGTFESGLPVSKPTATSSSRRKWSISSAFHKATKSPKATSSVKESASFQDLQSAAAGRRERDRTSSFGAHLADAALPRRLAASTSDIASIASGKSTHEGSYGVGATGSLGRSSIRSGKVPSFTRTRTSSQSSVSTTRTAQTSSIPTAVSSSMPPPSVVATSPGRSRSSLINPRRTPSGIPFFSRKSSAASDISLKTPSPNIDKGSFPSPVEEKTTSSGRKSILGLNFLRSGGSSRRGSAEKGPLSPSMSSSSKRSTFSSATSSAASRQTESYGSSAAMDEFGRRASLATPKSSSLLTRKRGKTIGSADKGDVFGSTQPVQLPPMQINALPPATARRVDSMSSTSGATRPALTGSASGSVLQTPRTRTSRLQESIKANLPTIAGSPSTHAYAAEPEARSFRAGHSPSTTPPPVSHTPTKIPRLKGTSSATASPRTSPVTATTVSAKPVPRRMGSSNSTLDSSSQLSASLSSNTKSPLLNNDDTGEFGFVNREPGLALGEKTLSTRRRTESESIGPSQIPRSRSTTSGIASLSASTRSTKESMEPPTASSRTAVPRAGRRPSTVEEEKRTPSASSAKAYTRSSALSSSTSRLPSQQASEPSSSASTVVGISASARKPLTKTSTTNEVSGIRRASVPASSVAIEPLSVNKSKSFASKMSLPTRVPKPASTASRLSPSTGTESGRSSAASGSYGVDEDKVKGDEEMAAYVRRQVSKNLSKGVSEEKVRKMFEFPDPTEPLPPLSPEDALSLYSRYLSPYEKEEIRDYKQVFFVGPNCDKKQAVKENPTNNFGYDDERGDYLLVTHDHIQFRYEVIDVLGKGSFGQVLQCRDHKTGEMVAVKIIRNKKRFHHQALVEIKVLENLVKWDPDEKHYVIRMVDSFSFRGHLCIVTELLSINLYELVKANSFAGFSTTLIRRFASQILKSLILLYHHRVVHCDLKPENILLRHPAKSGIKVIDFGSSCFENEKVYTYIQSRFYRSPEVILGMNYHMGIDMWSLGCILAEMYTGYPIFPGENEQEQLACIMEVQGLPDRYLIDRSSRKRLFFDSTGAPRPVVNSKGRRRRPASKTLESVLRCQDELFVDFIAKCLAWDPDRRMKPEKALRHPWIAGARSLTPANIPSRVSRASSGLSSSNSSRTAAASSHSSSPSISTPLKKLPSQASTSTAPVPRTRTVSYNSSSLSSTATGATRLASKGSLGLPSSSRYSVKAP